MSPARGDRNRWLAMGILCMGALMIVLDVTIVNVALPSIRADLHFDDASLAWAVNAYMLIFGGFLRLACLGLALFTRPPLHVMLARHILPGMALLGGFGLRRQSGSSPDFVSS